MKKLALGLLLGICASLAFAQQAGNVRVRGQVTAFDGKVLQIQAREGGALEVAVPDDVPVSGTRSITLADIAPGMALGVTTIQRGGDVIAIDIRPIPATAPMGLSPFDLQPNSTMTNATLEGQVQSSGGSELVLNYKTGTVKVLVPPGTPMSQAIPGNRADIKAGETVFIAARLGADGKLTATRIQVSTNGVKPTQ